MVKLGYLDGGDSFREKSVIAGKYRYLTVSTESGEDDSVVRVYSHATGSYLKLSPNRMVEKVDKIPDEYIKESSRVIKKRDKK